MADSKLVESLLYQSEGTAVDFKRDQYPFDLATEREKSELLKDVLAFANSSRQGDAYILIGVDAVVSGRHEPVGINLEDHFDDAQLQQFINSKTNRPIEMSYDSISYEGNSIGIITISKQKRPFYAKRNYGKVQKEVVYYRLGSSTAIAKPEDIARMGEDTVVRDLSPQMVLQFAEHTKREALGSSIRISSIAYAPPSRTLPDLVQETVSLGGWSLPPSAFERVNPNYLRKKEEFIRLSSLCTPVGFMIYNSSPTLAEQVRIEIKGDNGSGISILEDLPDEPEHSGAMVGIPLPRPSFLHNPMISVEHHGSQWTTTIRFGNVQPKAKVWSDEPLYIGSNSLKRLEPEAFIFADNLPSPQKVKLTIDFDIKNESPLDVDSLMP